jgi:hypothetical protein
VRVGVREDGLPRKEEEGGRRNFPRKEEGGGRREE